MAGRGGHHASRGGDELTVRGVHQGDEDRHGEITRAQIEKLGALHAVEPTMLSLYLAVRPPANLTARALRPHGSLRRQGLPGRHHRRGQGPGGQLTWGRGSAPARRPERASAPGQAGDAGLVLVLNSGSSSVKFALVDPGSCQRVTDGLAERVGTPEAVQRTQHSSDDVVTEQLVDGSHRAIIVRILGDLPGAGPDPAGSDQGRLVGVGHRYGFHGTSYRFVSERTAALLGRPLTGLRLVIAHLGNGCSVAAIRDGVPVDTTMGLTPLEGLEMGTRSGDVDPGVFGYLAYRAGLTVGAITWALNTASGLAGLSGVGNDMRAVEAAAAGGNERARLALEVFVHRLAKAIAGMVVSLERFDALVFTGGIGENSSPVRSLVLGRLGFLGLTGDPAANARHGHGTGGRISRPGTALALVVPTDEELLIARDTARLIATVAASGRNR